MLPDEEDAVVCKVFFIFYIPIRIWNPIEEKREIKINPDLLQSFLNPYSKMMTMYVRTVTKMGLV